MNKIDEIKLLAKVALPLMAAFLAQKGMQLIDTLMMGRISPDALAAGALGTSIFTLAATFCMGTLNATGIFISWARGANLIVDIEISLQSGISLALLLALPGMIGIWIAPNILAKLGQNTGVVNDITLLLHGLVWGFPGFLLFSVFRAFISAFALTRIVMLICLLSIPLTFIADYILIYGLYGFPQLGIAGIGYANSGIMWFMFFCLLIYCKHHTLLKLHINSVRWLKINFSKIAAIFTLGAPSGLLSVLDAGMFSVAAIMMGYFGINALAAHQIAMQCANIAYAAPFALSLATSLQVGHAAGANDMAQAKRYTYAGLSIGLTISGFIALFFILFPETLTKLFLNNAKFNLQEINQISASFLSIAALFQCFDALQTIMNGALRGLKDTFIPMVLCLTCYWFLGIVSAYYLAFHTYLAARGIWYGLAIGICSAGLMLFVRFLNLKRRILDI